MHPVARQRQQPNSHSAQGTTKVKQHLLGELDHAAHRRTDLRRRNHQGGRKPATIKPTVAATHTNVVDNEGGVLAAA